MTRTEEIKSMYQSCVMPTYSPRLALVKGRGTKVWDADGKVYLDFMAGIAVNSVGHAHPRLLQAINHQAGELMHVSNLFFTENQMRLAAKLSSLSLNGKCFFCNSGAEANEGLIKLARLWGHDSGRYEIVCMKNSFHGRTLATVAATGQDKVKKGFEPMPEGFRHADFNDIHSVAAAITDKTVAILLEAIQGEGGVMPADPIFFAQIRQMCDQRNLLMLCDEIQCGMGRTGKWFGFQNYGVAPDAFSLAKGLGGGFPIGALVSNAKLADVLQVGKHASTFGGNPLACAAALATIQIIEEEGLVEKAQRNGELLLESFQDFAERFDHVKEVRGKGLMIGLVLDQPAKPFVDRMTDEGLLTIATAENVVRFVPPLNVKDGELEEAMDIVNDCLEAWHEEEAAPATEAAAQ